MTPSKCFVLELALLNYLLDTQKEDPPVLGQVVPRLETNPCVPRSKLPVVVIP